MKKTCGNCRTIQPFNSTHITCLCLGHRSCGTLKSVNSQGCKSWTGNDSGTTKQEKTK